MRVRGRVRVGGWGLGVRDGVSMPSSRATCVRVRARGRVKVRG